MEFDPWAMTPMPLLPAEQRTATWDEVLRGFDEELVRAEAERCIQCGHPLCIDGCPNRNPIPTFIGLVQEGRYAEAAAADYLQNALPSCTGRVCAWEAQCEGRCVLNARGEGVRVGAIERFIADYALAHPDEVAAAQTRISGSLSSTGRLPADFPYESLVRAYQDTTPPDQPDWLGGRDEAAAGRAVAVVGSGPAGLACADFLARRGAAVTVWEAQAQPGGLLRDGIPEFVLSHAVVEREVARLSDEGVVFRFGAALGRDITLDDLQKRFDAVFVAIGASRARGLGVPGEDAEGVWSAQAFLHRAKLATERPDVAPPPVGPRVLVIGAGNTAMDAARTAVRLGARDVRIVYRRTRAESPSRAVEIAHAIEEGVSFDYLVLPVELHKDERGRLISARLQRMRLGEPDASGRRRPEPVPGSEFDFPCDTLVQAVGYAVEGDALGHPEVLARGGWIQDQGDGVTTALPGVFAGGDDVRGPATVVEAIHDGRQAAQAIVDYLRQLGRAPSAALGTGVRAADAAATQVRDGAQGRHEAAAAVAAG